MERVVMITHWRKSITGARGRKSPFSAVSAAKSSGNVLSNTPLHSLIDMGDVGNVVVVLTSLYWHAGRKILENGSKSSKKIFPAVMERGMYFYTLKKSTEISPVL
jgi:hypothetical protein